MVIDATRQLPAEGGPEKWPAVSRVLLNEESPGTAALVDARWAEYWKDFGEVRTRAPAVAASLPNSTAGRCWRSARMRWAPAPESSDEFPAPVSTPTAIQARCMACPDVGHGIADVHGFLGSDSHALHAEQDSLGIEACAARHPVAVTISSKKSSRPARSRGRNDSPREAVQIPSRTPADLSISRMAPIPG